MKRKLLIIISFLVALTTLSFRKINTYASRSSATEQEFLNYANAAMGKYYPNGWCLKFVSDFFAGGYNDITGMGFPGAYGMGTAYSCYMNNVTRHDGDYNIPIGADVFYDGWVNIDGVWTEAGHIGIYLGDGWIMESSFGKVNKTALSKIYTYRYDGTLAVQYLGWAWHPNVTIISETRGTPMSTGYDRALPDGNYIIANTGANDKNSFMFLDIVGGEYPASSGTNVQLYGAVAGDAVAVHDLWTVTYDNNDKFYTIKQYGTNNCLDVANADTLEGKNVQVCNSNGSTAQKWAISRNGSSGFRLQAKCSGMSLDVTGGNVNVSGTNVQQWSNNDGVAQSWMFIPYLPDQPIEEGRYVLLYTQDPSYEVDVSGDTGDIENNTAVQLWDDTALSRYNSFDLIKIENGYYYLRHAASGKFLEVTNLSTNYKAKVAVHDGNGSLAQQWAIVRNGSGYSLIARCNGYALDLPDGTKQNGTRLEVYPTLNNDHQRWSIVQAEYQVSYHANEAESGVPASQTKYYKSDLRLSSSTPARTGYTFKCWENSAKTIQCHPGDTYSNDQDIDLYAVWERSGNLITYDANGGENAPVDQFKPYGESINLSDAIPTRVGYTFLGWSTNNKATAPDYQPGDRYDTDVDLSLYAVWRITNPPALHGHDAAMLAGDTREWRDFVELSHDGVLDYTLSVSSSGTVSIDGSTVTAIEAGLGQLVVTVEECPEITCTVDIQVYDLSNMMKLPSGLKKIKDKAFRNSGAAAVKVPNGCEEIGEWAFADNSNLVYIYIPKSVTRIARNAFDNSPGTTIYCYENSEAATMATEKNIRHVLLTEDWVLAENLPVGATVTSEKWTYKKSTTETMTSREPSVEGWIQTGYEWEETGQGTWDYANFPGGFDQGNYLYNSYNKNKLSSHELSGTKRVAGEAYHKSYLYWHWTFTDYVEESNRNVIVNDAKEYGVKVGNVYRDFVYFDAFDTTLSLSKEGMTTSGLRTYDDLWSTYHHPEYNLPEYASWWWYRTETMRQSYVDYQKIYIYSRIVVTQETSYAPIQEDEGISDVKHWVKYMY